MLILSIHDLSLPIADPVLKFLMVLVIILIAPILLNKIKVPHLLGLIIAGAAIGPNGLNLLARDSSIVVTGTTGLLYIMFLAGLEIDMGDFKRNKWKSLTFGIYTFIVPLVMGYLAGLYILGFSPLTSLLFASLFSSHTLIAYPLLGKLGISKNIAVNVTVGGTMITDILALLILAACVGMAQGEVGSIFWIRMTLSIVAFGVVVLVIFPMIGRWFFKKVKDKISQYIFVLVMIYLAALLAEIAGVEAIIGAFLAGLALNRLIPHTSALMNRIEFVGNAIFIPFFLISVGMLIDFKVFFKSWDTIMVAATMTLISLGGKYIAAVLTQKTFRFTREQGKLIFGLSSASAAATLAAVMVGYNIIISETETGEPIRLLNEHVLNGSILLILVSCTVSSFVTLANGQKIADQENEGILEDKGKEKESILMALNMPETVEYMVNLAVIVKSKANKDNVYALNVINEERNESSVRNAEKIIQEAVSVGAAADVAVGGLTRYDQDVIDGVNNVIKEKKVTDLIVAVDQEKGLSNSMVYNLYNGYLQSQHTNTLVYQATQPIATIKKQVVIIPPNASSEPGFFYALFRIWNIGKHTGAVLSFYTGKAMEILLKGIQDKVSVEAEFHSYSGWRDVEQVIRDVKENEGLIVMMAKRGMISFFPQMDRIPALLNTGFKGSNYLLIYPFKGDLEDYMELRSVSNHDDYVAIGKMVSSIFKA